MDADFHREWDSRLKGIAHNWARKYVWLDEDEAYSELLVWYAEACLHYDGTKGSFGTYFYYYQYKAMDRLRVLWRNDNCMMDWDIDRALSVEDTAARHAINCMLIELDKVHLSDDARKLLDFILTTDLTADSRHRRVGRHTVLDRARKLLDWSYERSEKAIDALKAFYGERAIA